MGWLWAVYIAGVVVGIVFTDGRPATRLALGLLWPIGPAALVVVVTILLVAAMIAFPLFGVAAVAGAAALWWWFY